MPRFDQTGPQGFGPATGRGMGTCLRNNMNMAFGRGRGFGMGCGRGFGYRPANNSEVIEDTKAYIEDLKSELKNSEELLKDLESNK